MHLWCWVVRDWMKRRHQWSRKTIRHHFQNHTQPCVMEWLFASWSWLWLWLWLSLSWLIALYCVASCNKHLNNMESIFVIIGLKKGTRLGGRWMTPNPPLIQSRRLTQTWSRNCIAVEKNWKIIRVGQVTHQCYQTTNNANRRDPSYEHGFHGWRRREKNAKEWGRS